MRRLELRSPVPEHLGESARSTLDPVIVQLCPKGEIARFDLPSGPGERAGHPHMGKRLAESLTGLVRKQPRSRVAIGEEWYSIVARRYGLTTHQLRCAIEDRLLRYRRATAAWGGSEKGVIVVEEEVVANLDSIRRYSRLGSTRFPPEMPRVEIWSRPVVILRDTLVEPGPRVYVRVRQLSPETILNHAWNRAYRAWWASPEYLQAKREVRTARARGVGVAERRRLRRRRMREWLAVHPDLDPRIK